MQQDASTRFCGWSFIAAAVLLWGGWVLLPAKIGTFFEPSDFGRVYDSFHFWIWTFRAHLFGMVVTVIALVSLAGLLAESPSRVMFWPGAAVVTSGMIVGALGAAFYYHHGAWGALQMHEKSPEEVGAFVEALRIDTEFVTCLVRFGRVFSGLGLVVLASGLIAHRVLPRWLCWFAVAIGVAAMGLTMLLPDDMDLYLPVFHVLCAWLLTMGVVILRNGLPAEENDGKRADPAQ